MDKLEIVTKVLAARDEILSGLTESDERKTALFALMVKGYEGLLEEGGIELVMKFFKDALDDGGSEAVRHFKH